MNNEFSELKIEELSLHFREGKIACLELIVSERAKGKLCNKLFTFLRKIDMEIKYRDHNGGWFRKNSDKGGYYPSTPIFPRAEYAFSAEAMINPCPIIETHYL